MRPARHEAGPVERPLLTAGHAHTHEDETGPGRRRRAAPRVMKKRVAAVHDHVARLEESSELIQSLVDRRARLDHQQDGARWLEYPDQLAERARRAEVAFRSMLRHEVVSALPRAVVNRDARPM